MVGFLVKIGLLSPNIYLAPLSLRTSHTLYPATVVLHYNIGFSSYFKH